MAEENPTAPRIDMRDPRDLLPAPWNPNRADPADEAKLEASIARHGMFKPIVCRELPDGRLQILGGHYRAAAAVRRGMAEVPVVNLGEVDEGRAREITLIDNGRYGRDDAVALADLIASLGDPAELASFLPYDTAELGAIAAATSVDLDTLGLDLEDAAAEREPPVPKAPKTHATMQFRVHLVEEPLVREAVEAVMRDQGFTASDQKSNAGDALVWIVREWRRLAAEAG